MKNNSTLRFISGISLLLFVISSFIASGQGCTVGSSCNWSGATYRYPNGSSTPVTIGCMGTNTGGSNWVSYGLGWGGSGTPVLVFTAVAGQDYTFTLSGGQTTGSNYLINIHTGSTPGAGACIKSATARFISPTFASSCTLNVLSTDLVAGNNYIVQYAEC